MTQWLKKFGMTPSRAAVMAVLALVLAFVWGPQLISSPSEPLAVVRPAPRPVAPSTTPAALPTALATAVTGAEQPPRSIPTISASEAGAYDPFVAPAWSPASMSLLTDGVAGAGSPAAARFEAIRSKGIAMILVSPDGKAAQLGDRILRVGDEVDGFEVVDITIEGVVFKTTPSKSAEGFDGG